MFLVPSLAPVIPDLAMGRLQFVFVGMDNFIVEMQRIENLLPRYCYITIDTEYPGTVHGALAGSALIPAARYYALVKGKHRREVPPLQLGLTICDEEGNLATVVDVDSGPCSSLRSSTSRTSFDVARDPHSAESVHFLRAQGFNFPYARVHVIPSTDFAHMVKMLSGGEPFPETLGVFVSWVRDLLHGPVFDTKYMAKHCGRAELCAGGLRNVAAILGMPQLVPAPPSLAGPKSHTACCIFNVMRMIIHGGAGYDGFIDGIY